MSFLTHIKKKHPSRTPQSWSLPSEDYESKETLKAIDQLVESMEQDEKRISQLDTNRRVESCICLISGKVLGVFNQTRLSILNLLPSIHLLLFLLHAINFL